MQPKLQERRRGRTAETPCSPAAPETGLAGRRVVAEHKDVRCGVPKGIRLHERAFDVAEELSFEPSSPRRARKVCFADDESEKQVKNAELQEEPRDLNAKKNVMKMEEKL